ncbi:hypothetical protein ES705_41414 [subsurface metagenome]
MEKELTPEQYRVLRLKVTERAFTDQYWNLIENKAIVVMKEQFVEEIECEVRAVFNK